MEQYKTINKRLDKIENLLFSQKTILNLYKVAQYTKLSKNCMYKLTLKLKIKIEKSGKGQKPSK